MEYEYIDDLIVRYPPLSVCNKEIHNVYEIIKEGFESGHKLLICGNGGSCADSQHIVGELMKSFAIRRHISIEDKRRLISLYGTEGEKMADYLEKGLPAISLDTIPVVATAFSNDVSAEYVYAQILYNYGEKGDVLLAISTSGNSVNVINAIKLAKMMGIRTVGLTGESGGRLSGLCDEAIHAPAKCSYQIQEYHVPIYHTLCIMLEKYFCCCKVENCGGIDGYTEG